jgi:uncharacterized membrane protein
MQSFHGVWHAASFLTLAWLAIFFGRTLRPGQTPLIERIARVSEPDMTPPLCRYTRQLTAVWCGYFVIAALVSVSLVDTFPGTGVLVLLGSAMLFAGEHRLRPHLFPGRAFPGLLQQVRDTWSVWYPRRTPE